MKYIIECKNNAWRATNVPLDTAYADMLNRPADQIFTSWRDAERAAKLRNSTVVKSTRAGDASPSTWDTDSGLGIGGINNDESMPFIPSERAIARVQRMYDTDTICRRCGGSKNFSGAMFTTIGGNICDDCA